MNRNQNKIPLDELISKTIAGEILDFDFKKWKQQHQQDIHKFTTKTKQPNVLTNTWRIIMKSKITKLATAALIIIAVSAGIIQLLPNGKDVLDRSKVERVGEVQVDEQDVDARLQAELREVEQCFFAGSTGRLADFLATGMWESKASAANYLGKIGDRSVIPPLEQLSATLTGDEANNPFASAIEGITDRHNRLEALMADFAPHGVLSGLITDVETSEPIEAAEVHISGGGRVYVAMTDVNGIYVFEDIEEQGNYKMNIFSDQYLGIPPWQEAPSVTLRPSTQVVKHFQLRYGFELDVSVVDEAGEPIPDVNLFGSWMSKHKLGRYFTDVNGLATLGAIEPRYVHSITARHDDYALAWTWTEEGDPEGFYEIVMQKGVPVRGYVEYDDGVPAGGLRISAHPFWGHRSILPPKTYQIDPNGYFTLPHIIRREQGHSSHIGYGIIIHIPHGIHGETPICIMNANLPLEDNSLLTLTLPRKSPGALASISGTFKFVGERVPERIDVTAHPLQGQKDCQTGYDSVLPDDGRFSVDSLNPGVYTLIFSGPNIERKDIHNINAPIKDLEVELNYTVRPELTGVVLSNETGEPVKYFMARAKKLKTLRGVPTSQSDFWYEFDNAEGTFGIKTIGPGIYEVQIEAQGFNRTLSEQINTDENHPVTIRLSRGGSIKGRVVDENGHGIDGAKVISISQARGITSQMSEAIISTDGAVVTKNGSFVLENVPAGKESIQITHPNYAPAIKEDIQIINGTTTETVEVILVKGGIVQGHSAKMASFYLWDELSYRHLDNHKRWLRTEPNPKARIASMQKFYQVEHLPERICYVACEMQNFSHAGIRNWDWTFRAVVPANGTTTDLSFGGKPNVVGQLQAGGTDPLTAIVLRSLDSRVFEDYVLVDPRGQFSFSSVPPGAYAIHYSIIVHGYPPAIVKGDTIATFDMGREDVDLGIIPKHTGEVFVSLRVNDDNEPLNVSSVLLERGTNIFSGSDVTYTAKRTSENDPWIARNVIPGTYSVIVKRPDAVTIRQPIEYEQDQDKLEVSLQIPEGKAIIKGQFITNSELPLLLWRSDERIVVRFFPNKSGTYMIEQLPAGDYSIGDQLVGNSFPLVTFNLSENENKTIDIDTTDWHATGMRPLLIQAVAEDGIMLPGASIWLESFAGEIEPVYQTPDGYFFFVDAGQYNICAVYEGYQETRKKVCLEEAKDIRVAHWQEPTVIKLLKN
ncbi:MAG: carboxypeptidase regulatory-like domain-containing protein [Planctomycetota bacterium]|jgi:hypothetical protein